jgi:hypothetical protein
MQWDLVERESQRFQSLLLLLLEIVKQTVCTILSLVLECIANCLFIS